MADSATPNETNRIFTDAFNKTIKEIPFDKAWSNGIGMFDMAVYGNNAPKLGNGEMVKSITPGGRRLLLIGTRLGNLVVFDRMMEQKGPAPKSNVFTFNTTAAVLQGGWFSDSPAIDEYEMGLAVGVGSEGNLGWRIEQIYKLASKKEGA